MSKTKPSDSLEVDGEGRRITVYLDTVSVLGIELIQSYLTEQLPRGCGCSVSMAMRAAIGYYAQHCARELGVSDEQKASEGRDRQSAEQQHRRRHGEPVTGTDGDGSVIGIGPID